MLSGVLADPRRVLYGVLAALCVFAVIAHPRVAPEADALGLNEQKISPALLAEMQLDPLRPLPVILEMKPLGAPFPSGVNALLASQALAILRANGHGFGALPILNGAAGSATAPQIQAMSLLPQVALIEPDAPVGPRKPSTSRPRLNRPTSSLYTREVRADQVWPRGVTGRGVTVAVLDSGVARDPDLVASGNRILASVTFTSGDPTTPDDGGHGTHIAGTIAGDGTNSAGQYVGIAPRANIVDVKVLDAQGRGRVSSVLAGFQWVLANKDRYNIRIVNLSLGAPPIGTYRSDPLATAAEIAWHNGLVVVAASGNTGGDGVESPGIDPYVITVGSTDDEVTLPLADDVLAWFSSFGTPPLSTAKPDLVAPGRQVIAPRVPHSALDQLLPDHVVNAANGSTYFRLTGTSMATAVVSGAAALLLQQRPGLTPDQVKQLLVGNTQGFGGNDSAPGAGAGLLDVYRASAAAPSGTTNRGLRPADGFARVVYPLLYGRPLVWKDPTYLGQDWSRLLWSALDWAAPAWDNIAWDNIAWDNIAWDNIAWDNIAWDNIAWDNIAWDNIAWDNIAWDNVAWD